MKKIDWKQNTKSTIEVCFIGELDAYFTQHEQELYDLGLRAISRRYDKKNRKTYTTYKKVL